MNWKLARDVRRVDSIATDDDDEESFDDRSERFLRIAAAGCEVYVKVVVTVETRQPELDEICRRIGAVDPGITLVLQPVTPFGRIRRSPSADILLPLQRGCERLLADVRVIPQTHRIYQAL